DNLLPGYNNAPIGLTGKWSISRQGGAFSCTNQALGGDPFPDRAKHCEYDHAWQWCGDENGWCHIPGWISPSSKLEVRYGAVAPGDSGGRGSWIVMAGGWVRPNTDIQCTTGLFGQDPNPGYVKGCWLDISD